MKTKTTFAELMRWRFDRAARDAPPAPRAARLLDASRPWWERCPGEFQSLVERLAAMRMNYGHAMVERRAADAGHCVSTLVVNSEGESEIAMRPLYWDLRGSRLHLRFEPEAVGLTLAAVHEATLVAHDSLQPVLAAPIRRSVAGEYWLEAEIPDDLRRAWADVRVTDPMPFRLILRTPESAA